MGTKFQFGKMKQFWRWKKHSGAKYPLNPAKFYLLRRERVGGSDASHDSVFSVNPNYLCSPPVEFSYISLARIKLLGFSEQQEWLEKALRSFPTLELRRNIGRRKLRVSTICTTYGLCPVCCWRTAEHIEIRPGIGPAFLISSPEVLDVWCILCCLYFHQKGLSGKIFFKDKSFLLLVLKLFTC